MASWWKPSSSSAAASTTAAAAASPATEPAAEGEETKAQLRRRVQVLLEQNERYETRFRDVVGAYKSMLAEKEALEKTLAALTEGSSSNRAAGQQQQGASPAAKAEKSGGESGGEAKDKDSASASDGNDSDAGSASATTSAPTSASGGGEAASDDTAAASQQKIETLAKALSTLTQEKRTMERRFQEDKKAVADAHRAAIATLRQEHETALEGLKQELSLARADKARCEAAVQTLTQQLIARNETDQQRDGRLERERKVHQEEVAELMKQRQSSEQLRERVAVLEEKLQKARDAELEALTQLSSGTADLKTKVATLEAELEASRTQLASAQSKGDTEEVLKLRQENRAQKKTIDTLRQTNADVNKKLQSVTDMAQKQVEEAQLKLAAATRAQADAEAIARTERLTNESRVSELSLLIGKYEAARLQDNETITRLQAEVVELAAAGRAPESPVRSDAHDDVQALHAKIAKLKTLLHHANERLLERNSSSSELRPPSAMPADQADKDVMPELLQARQEANQYYLHAQSSLNAKAELQHQVATLRNEKADLEARLHSLQTRLSEAEREHALHCELQKQTLEAQHREAMDSLRDSQRVILDDLQKRNQRARERTAALLEDRDAEIARLRQQLSEGRHSESSSSTTAVTASADGNRERSPSSSTATFAPLTNGNTVSSTSSPRSSSPAGQGAGSSMPRRSSVAPSELDGMATGGALMHLRTIENKAADERRELRKSIRELQTSLQEAQMRSTLQDEQISVLKEEVRRGERNAKRGEANLEYLKNVIVKYMSESITRDKLIPAIATILQFSPDELRAVQQTEEKWRWGWSSPTKRV
eukprot:m.176097 g.176097  ORF g.176097 m.176097 type:complete len:830 (+) comp17360_c0_seq1:57-2546(+)